MYRCPHCKMIDGEMVKRGYCIHCKEDVGAALPAEVEEAPARSASRSAEEFKCPECGRFSDSIKCYRMGVLIFLVLFWAMSTKRELGCPSCIRAKIASFCLVNLITANVLWPIVILPWTLILLARSFTKGHSAV